MSQCVAPTKRGARCSKGAQTGSMCCFIHGLTPDERLARMRELNRLAVRSKQMRGRRRCPHCGGRL
jgi:hypothetical protein